MRLLLDTHVALWWLNDPARLDPIARTAIGAGDNEVRVSAASVWEVAIKTATGRLAAPTPFVAALGSAGIEELPVRWTHADRVMSLPDHHRDPFDRILMAQALEEDMVIVTRDAAIARYAVPTMLA